MIYGVVGIKRWSNTSRVGTSTFRVILETEGMQILHRSCGLGLKGCYKNRHVWFRLEVLPKLQGVILGCQSTGQVGSPLLLRPEFLVRVCGSPQLHWNRTRSSESKDITLDEQTRLGDSFPLHWSL